MTDHQISELVAAHVMGWKASDCGNAWIAMDGSRRPRRQWITGERPWNPAEDMNDAMEAAAKLQRDGCMVTVRLLWDQHGDPRTCASVLREGGDKEIEVEWAEPPRALCVAMLSAVGVEVTS